MLDSIFNNAKYKNRIKKIISESSQILSENSQNEQGFGIFNPNLFLEIFTNYNFNENIQFEILPNILNFSNSNPYYFPYSTQPLYYSMFPMTFTVQIASYNSPIFDLKNVSISNNDSCINLKLPNFLKYEGFIGIIPFGLTVTKSCENIVSKTEKILFNVEILSNNKITYTNFTIFIDIIGKPHRRYRILWDEFHSLIPYENSDKKLENEYHNIKNILYHKYINFYKFIRQQGYFLEILKSPWTCYNPRNYGSLLILAPTREFGTLEMNKLRNDIENTQLSLIIFGEYQDNLFSMKQINSLLKPYFITLGNERYSGEFSFDISPYLVSVSSSLSITRFPKNGFLLSGNLLNEVTALTNSSSASEDVAIFGFIPRVFF